MRYPIDIKKFEANLIEAKPIIKQINCSVSLLNIFDLNEIYDYYWNNFGIRTTFMNIVRGPEFLSIRNLPQEIKNDLIEKYKDITDGLYIKNELLLPKKFELKEAEEYCDKLSASRNFDWRKIWNWNV